jgi:transposase-like protein
MMECPECKSTHIHKNGHKKGKQNYLCVDCRRQFIDSDESERLCYSKSKEILKHSVRLLVGSPANVVISKLITSLSSCQNF